jgi:hypothetical protein
MSEVLFQCTYTSRLTGFGAGRSAVLDAIEASAARNNVRLGVTGSLMVSGARVVQVLEGPEPAVRALLTTIAADARHTEFEVLSEHTVPDRTFGDWSMAVRDLDAAGPSADGLRALVAAYERSFRFAAADWVAMVRRYLLVSGSGRPA